MRSWCIFKKSKNQIFNETIAKGKHIDEHDSKYIYIYQ